jgi:Ca2+-binding RTX toxin-like protein
MGLTVTQANALLDTAQTAEDLRNIIRQLDTDTHGSITLAYSGGLDRQKGIDLGTYPDLNGYTAPWTNNVASELAKTQSNLRVLDNTQAFKFMDILGDPEKPNFNVPFFNALQRIFGDNPRDWENNSQANQFLFGSRDASGNRSADGAFDIVSKNFADGATGKVIALVPFAQEGQVFGATELKALLENPNVTEINGIPKSELLQKNLLDGSTAVFEHIRSTSYAQVAGSDLINSIRNVDGSLTLKGLNDYLGDAQDVLNYYKNHPEAYDRFTASYIQLSSELQNNYNYSPLKYANDIEYIGSSGTATLNKIGQIGTLIGFATAIAQATYAHNNGDDEGAKEILKAFAFEGAGGAVGGYFGSVVAGLVAGGLAAVGVTVSAPVSGALVLIGALVGGIYGGDAAKDLYELSKDKDENGKMDMFDRMANFIYGATEFKITDPTIVSLVGGTLQQIKTNISSETIIQNAKTDIAWRYALFAMNPFVVQGISYNNHNLDGKLDLYDGETGKGMTEQYLKDRADMLAWFVRYYTGQLDDDDSLSDIVDGHKPYDDNWDTDAVEGNWDYIALDRTLRGVQQFKLTIDGEGLSLKNHKVIFGSAKDETIEGDTLDDRLYGGAGVDKLYGGKGDDYLEGGAGDDELYGGDDHDRLAGLSGIDKLYGGDGNDVLNGGSGDDQLYGGDGNDYLHGSLDNDYLGGGTGNDILVGGKGWLNAEGGDDNDIWSDFTVGNTATNVNADKIDIGHLLIDYTGNYSIDGLSLYCRTMVSGSNTQLYIDRDGGGSGYSSTLLLTLNGVNTDLNALLNNQQMMI